MRVCIATGGTGGHIYPAVSLARAFMDHDASTEVLFIGNNDRMEATEIPALGFRFVGLPAKGFNGSLIKKFEALYALFASQKKAKVILREFKPDAVIGFGGYVSVPVLRAAHSDKIWTMIHEQNSFAGKANRLLAKTADAIVVSYPENLTQFPLNKTQLLGNPRTYEIKRAVHDDSLITQLGLSLAEPTVLIVMGSLGSETINALMSVALEMMKHKDYQIIYVTGKKHYDAFITSNDEDENIKIIPYIDQLSMMNQIDLLVTRGGATTAAEITALGVASIIIPSPFVPNNHQVLNAKSLADSGGCIMIEESELTPYKIVNQIEELLEDYVRLESMKKAALKLGKPNAAEDMIEWVNKEAKVH